MSRSLLAWSLEGGKSSFDLTSFVENSTMNKDFEFNRLSRSLLTLAACCTVIIMAVGVAGNLLTIVALLRCPRVRNVAAAFIISLCVADCMFCVLVLPFGASRFFYGTWVHSDSLCTIVPLIRYANVGVSLLSIAMITINRYIMIAHYGAYTKIYKPMWIVAMIVFSWVFSFGMQVPTLLQGWGKYSYDKRLGTCTIVEDDAGRSAKTPLFIIGFVIPCLIIVLCYARIFWVVHSSETRLRKHAANSAKDSQGTSKEKKEAKNRRNEWRITKMVLAIFLSFIVCYLPITTVKVVDSDVRYPGLHVIAYILLYLSACINPIIYVIMNKQYRQAYKTVLMCHKPRMLSTTPGPGSSYGDKSKDEVSKTMVSQVSIAMTPIRNDDMKIVFDDHL